MLLGVLCESVAKSNHIDKDKYFLITIDVEDWFQVENFKSWIPFETWDQCELRVEKNTHQLLDLFDSIELPVLLASQPYSSCRPKATFFVLGWIAEKLPQLVREIHSRGHEIASHGYNHDLSNHLSSSELKQDLTDSKKRLENLTGSPIFGYRAPSFAINDYILKIIEDCGYLYDSSYNSFSMHGRYGQISSDGSGKFGVAHKVSGNFFELPISNLRLFNKVLPLGGGAYFRLIPLPLFTLGIKSILQKEDAYILYLHPWELDSGQPRVREASTNFKFRHYSNLSKTQGRLKRLIKNFKNCSFGTCSHYLTEIE